MAKEKSKHDGLLCFLLALIVVLLLVIGAGGYYFLVLQNNIDNKYIFSELDEYLKSKEEYICLTC